MGGDRRAEIVRVALDLLDENGLDAVSLRAVAARLGVRLNTVSWHIKTKARLRDLMADAIISTIALDALPASWSDAVRELLRRYRRALLEHRDGGQVVAGTFAAEPATLRYAEQLMAALLAGNLDERAAGWTAWTLIYFTLGLVQEEQGAPGALADQVAPAIDVMAHPALVRTLPHLVDGAFDGRFEYGLDLVLSSAQRYISPGLENR
jgi:TetR/AcrR family tetracycline transcriptional repressor